jgi:hypothetical protein
MEEELTALKNAKLDILDGRIQKFHKGDTSYTLLNFKDLCQCIQQLETEISVIKTEPKVSQCQAI